MKILLTSTIGLILLFCGLNNPLSDSVDLLHHDCDCTSAMGGTASATCQDSQSCSCTSGFFGCSCSCSSSRQENGDPFTVEYPGTRNAYTLEELPNENHWLTVQNILEKEGNSTAKQLLDSMDGVYSLASKNPNAFLQKALELEAIYKKLPISIQSKLEQAIK